MANERVREIGDKAWRYIRGTVMLLLSVGVLLCVRRSVTFRRAHVTPPRPPPQHHSACFLTNSTRWWRLWFFLPGLLMVHEYLTGYRGL